MLQGAEGRKGGRKRGAEDSGVKEPFESTPAGLTHTILPPPTPLSSSSSSSSARQKKTHHVDRSSRGKLLFSSRLPSTAFVQPIRLIGRDVAERRPHFLLFPRRKGPCGGSRRPERAKPRTPKTPAVASLVANRSDVTLSSDKPGLNPAGRLPVVPANDSSCDVACRSTDTDTVKTEGVFVSLF